MGLPRCSPRSASPNRRAMADTLNTLLWLAGDQWNASALDAKRQAIASLRGYAYQLHQSLAAWIALPDDATLHLEISEDYAQIARDPATLETVLTATQIKDTRESGCVTLNSADVKAAIRNFWALREANPGKPVRFVFLTTSPIGQERADPIDGAAGLDLWRRAARAGPMETIRAALVTRFASEADEQSGLAQFLRESDDEALRAAILSPIRWVAGSPPIEAIAKDNRSALIVLGQHFGGLPDLSARAADILLAQILDAIVGGGDRRLRRGDLLLSLQDALSVRVPAGQALLGPSPIRQGLDLDATGAWRLVSRMPPRCAPRETAIRDLRAALGTGGVAWMHGATGLGKSILAELAAHAIGGPWRLLDLRGATSAIVRERLIAARLAILTDPEIAGLIIDDLAPADETQIEAGLAELAASLQQRGIPLIITSNHPPGQRLKRALDLPDSGVHAAPAFESEDSAALVVAYGGDPAKWSWFALFVGGAHPQLVDVAIAGLAREGWPDDAMKTWISTGMKNPDVEAEREAARRRLLAELAPDVLTFLARTVRIYGTFDRALGVAVGAATPALAAPGLALDQLTGHWIERVYLGRLRSSPLVSGLDLEMLDAEALKALDIAIVKHILTRTSVEADLFDTAFYHAWLAGDESWVNWIVQQVIQTSDEDRPKLASLMPTFRSAQPDPAFLANRPYPKIYLRLAQHLLQSAIGSDAEVAASAENLIDRLDRMEEESDEVRRSLAAVVLMKLLFDPYGYGRIPDWFDHLQRFVRIAQEDPDFSRVADRLAARADADPAGYMFVAHAARLSGVAALAGLFDALDALSPEARQPWLDAMSEPSIALAMIVDNAWLKESRRDEFDARVTAAEFARFGSMALAWQAIPLAGRCFRSQALILDEYAKDRDAAYAALDHATALLPDNFDIERERGKIAWRADDYAQAYGILKGLEHRYGDVGGVEAAFALREAAISAAHIDLPLEAARLFDKAQDFALESGDGKPTPLSIGLAADAVAARFGAGEEATAVRGMATVLDNLVGIDPKERQTAHSVHLLAKHLVLWMRDKHEPMLVDDGPPFYPPGAASNPDPNPALVDLPVTPFGPAWMLLARVALRAAVPPDEIIAWPGLIAAREDADLDTMVRYDLLDHAIESGNLDDFRRFLVPAIEGFVHSEGRIASGWDYDPLKVSKSSIMALSPGALAEGRARGYLRDAALARSLVAMTIEDRTPDHHLATRTTLIEAAGFDAMPEWGDGAPEDPQDRQQTIARAIVVTSDAHAHSIENLFIAHLRLLEWIRNSNHKKVATAALARRVRRDWSAIVRDRRALLVMPMVNTPALEAALSSIDDDARFIARVLLAAEPAVSVGLSDEVRALLSTIRDNG
jgi:hypothetical protein